MIFESKASVFLLGLLPKRTPLRLSNVSSLPKKHFPHCVHSHASTCKYARRAEKGTNASLWRQPLVTYKCSVTVPPAMPPVVEANATHPLQQSMIMVCVISFLKDRHSLRRPFPPLTKNGLGISSLSGSQIGTSPPLLRFSFLVSSTISFSALCA